jgi:hypothetical protein
MKDPEGTEFDTGQEVVGELAGDQHGLRVVERVRRRDDARVDDCGEAVFSRRKHECPSQVSCIVLLPAEGASAVAAAAVPGRAVAASRAAAGIAAAPDSRRRRRLSSRREADSGMANSR